MFGATAIKLLQQESKKFLGDLFIMAEQLACHADRLEADEVSEPPSSKLQNIASRLSPGFITKTDGRLERYAACLEAFSDCSWR